MLSLQRKTSSSANNAGGSGTKNNNTAEAGIDGVMEKEDVGIGEMDSEVVVKGRRSSLKGFLHSVSSPRTSGLKKASATGGTSSSSADDSTNNNNNNNNSNSLQFGSPSLKTMKSASSSTSSSSSSSSAVPAPAPSTASGSGNQPGPSGLAKVGKSLSTLKARKGSSTTNNNYEIGSGIGDMETEITMSEALRGDDIRPPNDPPSSSTLSPRLFWQSRKSSMGSGNQQEGGKEDDKKIQNNEKSKDYEGRMF